jgi:histidine triad (HIT) family protein
VSDCLFCDILAGDMPAEFVWDDDQVAAFLDTRPLFKGHVLVLPRPHYVTLADLPASLLTPLFTRVREISAAMPAAYASQGSFVAMNNIVSQSVPHLHVHVVPRTKGDGLRGFFWPRGRYASDEEAAGYAARLREVLASQPASTPASTPGEAPARTTADRDGRTG